ncbi:DUF411 domain-containing protein [Thermomonas carbonis]|uniref:DUF411 domain-containing protein n=2 Tax=Thermomonas carbonis TaxID=1463158 RepID=A0A7G9SUI5_9GAMM|nr:DUF411 domain-containing protein [Thermomonas carbonis]
MATSCQADPGGIASAPDQNKPISTHAPTTKKLSATPATSTPTAALAAADVLPPVLVHKSASCGCCGAWVDHLRGAGFTVRVNETEDLNPIKERLGVPDGKGSCHTAEVGGYMVEGHVPADDIKRLLVERPKGKGLVLPGMPIGSPGMEVPDGTVQPYTVELVAPDGRSHPFARHGR